MNLIVEMGGMQVSDDPKVTLVTYAPGKILEANHIPLPGENVGVQVNRTVCLGMSSGRVWVKSSGDGEREL